MSHDTAKAMLRNGVGPFFGDPFLDDVMRQEQERGYDYATMDSEAWAERVKIIAAEIKADLRHR
jgi:hypothetical protein